MCFFRPQKKGPVSGAQSGRKPIVLTMNQPMKRETVPFHWEDRISPVSGDRAGVSCLSK